MKNLQVLLSGLVIAAVALSCRLIPAVPQFNTITPSNTVISETREVSGFNGISFATFGKVTITQGDSESLTIKGSDNIVPLIQTTVKNGILEIKMKEGYNIAAIKQESVLTFTITAKDLTSLDVSGAGLLTMDSLTAPSLSLNMSGAGEINLGQLATESLDLNLSGLGKITLAGSAKDAKVNISGAGGVEAGDLQCQTMDINISGLGSATVWVTDTLSGNISGAGNVSYYGDPKLSTQNSGIGQFKSLGSK